MLLITSPVVPGVCPAHAIERFADPMQRFATAGLPD
jgi:hypothetical protein